MHHLSHLVDSFNHLASRAGSFPVFEWGGQVKNQLSHVFKSVMSHRLLTQHQKETQKLVKRVLQNMFDELEKHREGHRLFEKLRFFKKLPIFASFESRSVR
jgi:hypothetical protein